MFELSFQPVQSIVVGVSALLCWVFIKADRFGKSKLIRLSIAVFFIGLFLGLSPIKFKQEGIAKIERDVDRFEKIPPRVDVEQKAFTEKQIDELQKLKLYSEDIQDEIHN